MGKLVGIFSRVLGQNCYAEEEVNPTSVRLRIFSSSRKFLFDIRNIRLDRLMGRIAHIWAQLFRHEADRGHRSVTERRRPFSDLFRQLDEAQLKMVERIEIRWGDEFLKRILESGTDVLERDLKSVLVAPVGKGLVNLASDTSTRKIVTDEMDYYLDISQLGRVLNLSLSQPRDRIVLNSFLGRMIDTTTVVQSHSDRPLTGVRVFLIHHLTAEVLGFIEALRSLGCRDLVTLFVSYSGEPPTSYLDPLSSCQPTNFAVCR